MKLFTVVLNALMDAIVVAVVAAAGLYTYNAWDKLPEAASAAPGVQAAGANSTDTIAAILTEPDSGPGGRTIRWQQDTVTVLVDLPDSHRAIEQTVDQALAWNSAHTGIHFQRTDGADADMTIRGQDTPGGHVTVSGRLEDGIITEAAITLGCCLERPVWEEIAQAAGATGDRAAGGSVFSNNYDVITPTDFDALVIQTLYQLPPAASRDDILRHLAAGITQPART